MLVVQPDLSPEEQGPAAQASSREGKRMGTFWTYVLDFFGLAGLVQPAGSARAGGSAAPVRPTILRDRPSDEE